MAIDFIRVHLFKRHFGHSAVKAAAYRAGLRLHDERLGLTYDYSKREDVVYCAMALPDGADERFKEFEFFWNELERKEKRKDSQLGKDVILALPKELPLEQLKALVDLYVYTYYTSKGVPVQKAIHMPKDGANPHAHLFTPMRRLHGSRFGHKARDLNPNFFKGKIEHQFLNRQWRQFQNDFFKAHDIDLKVDANRLVRERHQGRIRESSGHYLKAENERAKQQALKIALDDTQAILNQLSHDFAVFDERDIAKLLHKTGLEGQAFIHTLARIKAHEDVIALGVGEHGRMGYTTRVNFEREAQLALDADRLSKQREHTVSVAKARRLAKQNQLNEGQRHALKYLAKSGDIACVVGRAGTGKTTYLLKAARQLWEDEGYRVMGIAPTGRAATGLQADAGIKAYTLHAFLMRCEKLPHAIKPHTVIVMDEAGMTSTHLMHEVLRVARDAGAKLVAVGDPDQLQAPTGGSPFRALMERVGFVELDTIVRQRNPEQRKATSQLAKGQSANAIDFYQREGAIEFADHSEAAQDILLAKWLAATHQDGLESSLILSTKRADVCALNEKAHALLQQQGRLDKNIYTLKAEGKLLELQVGERLLLTKNDRELGVTNGDLATLIDIQNDNLKARLDNGETVTLNKKHYAHLEYGYALTVHKAQGATAKHTFLSVTGHFWDRFLTYVAFSRHKESLTVVVDQQSVKDIKTLKQRLGRHVLVDTVLNWPLNYAIRQGYVPEDVAKRMVKDLGVQGKLTHLWRFIFNYHDTKAQLAKAQHSQQLARDIAWYSDLHLAVRKQWQTLHESLTENQKVFEHPNYNQVLKLEQYRFRLAADIQTRIHTLPQAEHVLHYNNIDPDKLAEHANTYQCITQAKAYLNAKKQGDALTAQRLAYTLYPQWQHVGRYLPLINDATLKLSQAELKRDYQDALMSRPTTYLGLIDETLIQTLRHYLSAEKARLHILRNVRQRQNQSQWTNPFVTPKRLTGFDKYAYPINQAMKPLTAIKNTAKFTAKSPLENTHLLNNKDAFLACNQSFYEKHQPMVNTTSDSLITLTKLQPTHWTAAPDTITQQATSQANWETYAGHQAERARLGVQLLAQIDKVAPVLERLAIPLEQLEGDCARHQANQRVKRFAKAQGCEQAWLAHVIKHDFKAHWSAFKTHEIDTSSLHLSAWRYDQALKKMHLNAQEKALLANWQRYQAVKRTAAKATAKAMTKNQRTGEIDNRDAKWHVARHWQVLRDELAAICLAQGFDDGFAEKRQIKSQQVSQLHTHVKAQSRHAFVLRYLKETRPLHRALMASYLDVNAKTYRLSLQHHKIKPWQLQRDTRRIHYLQTLKTLTPEQQSLYQLTDRYHQTQDAVKAYYFTHRHDLNPHHEQALYQLHQQRNILALELLKKTYELKDNHFFETVCLNEKTLLKQAKNALAFDTVQAYLNAKTQAEKTELAKTILATRACYQHVFAKNIDWQTLKIDTKRTTDKSLTNVQPDAAAKPLRPTETKAWSAETVNAALINLGENFYETVLGEPGKQQGGQLRFGRKGSFSVSLRGEHQGSWYSFETGEGGTPLSLLMNADYGYGLNFQDALKEGARLAGLSNANQTHAPLITKAKTNENLKAKLTEQKAKQKRIQTARYYVNSAKPIDGTLAERYLKETRSIEGKFPTLKYHPRVRDTREDEQGRQVTRYHPALVIPGINETGDVTCVQTILLDENAQKAKDVAVVKRTRGVVKGSAGCIQRGTSNQIIIAEGPETAASLAKAAPKAHIYITFGNIRNAEHLGWLAKKHGTQQFTFAMDKDNNDNNIKAVKKVAETLKAEHGIKSLWVFPELNQDKYDFNDVLKEKGIDAIKAQFTKIKPVLIEKPEKSISTSEQKPSNKHWLSSKYNGQWQQVFTLEDNAIKLAKTFVDLYQNTNDPILKIKNEMHVKALLQKAMQHPAIKKQLEKAAPRIVKEVNKQPEPIKALNSPSFTKEWEQLAEHISHPHIAALLALKEQETSSIKQQALKRQIAIVLQDKALNKLLETKTPRLLNQLKTWYYHHAKEREHRRGRD